MITMNTYDNESSSKKKFLVPLLVVLLCGVAMTGAAYAYSSQMDATVNANTSLYEITLKDDGTPNVITAACTGNVTFDSVVGATATTYKVSATDNTATFTVYIADGAKNTTDFTITTPASVSLYSDETCQTAVSSKLTAAATVSEHDITLTFSGEGLALSEIPDKIYAKLTISTTAKA